jgi:LmbE family N-acetylglucosaminyl deacetylase
MSDADPAGPSIERVLVVTAHPDDVDFGAAGTVALWTDEGIDVTYCILTDGDAGGHDESVDRASMGSIRRAEQEAAAKEVGVTELIWLGYPDGQLVVSMDLRWAITQVIRQVRPQRVVCQWPERNWKSIFASHPDHMAAGEATMCAVYPDARNPFAFLNLMGDRLPPHVVDEVWLMSSPDSDTFIDVTETFDRKVAALRHHASQLAASRDEIGGFLRGFLAANAATGGLPEGRLAEAFLRVLTGEPGSRRAGTDG